MIFDLSPLISNSFQHSCRALGNWLFCKTWVVCRLVRFCKCANVRLAKIIFFKCAVGKIFKTFGSDCVSPKSVRKFFVKMSKFVFQRSVFSEYCRSLGLLTTSRVLAIGGFKRTKADSSTKAK